MNQAGLIRPAINGDIPVIHRWLMGQSSEIESLRDNWDLTKKMFKEGQMIVYVDPISKEAIAYFWGSLHTTNSILDVRHEYRKQGVGRAMVDHLVNEATMAGQGLLRIQCAPESSAKFWTAMGFHLEPKEYGSSPVIAKRVLSIPKPLPERGKSAEVIVRFYMKTIFDNKVSPPMAEFRPAAKKTRAGRVWLGQKVACFAPPRNTELVIALLVDSKTVYEGKAHSKEAAAHGVISCESGYAIEKILP